MRSPTYGISDVKVSPGRSRAFRGSGINGQNGALNDAINKLSTGCVALVELGGWLKASTMVHFLTVGGRG